MRLYRLGFLCFCVALSGLLIFLAASAAQEASGYVKVIALALFVLAVVVVLGRGRIATTRLDPSAGDSSRLGLFAGLAAAGTAPIVLNASNNVRALFFAGLAGAVTTLTVEVGRGIRRISADEAVEKAAERRKAEAARRANRRARGSSDT